MECLHCKGHMAKSNAPYSVNRKGYHISWDSIPAWVCTQCGESYFEADEINHIQHALQKVDQETCILLSSKIA